MLSIKQLIKSTASASFLIMFAGASLAPALASADVGYGYNVPSGPVGISRFRNTHNGNHFYTASSAEASAVVSSGYYTLEGPAFNAYTQTAAGSSPVYRAYQVSSGDHLYTTSFAEYVRAVASSYNIEGVAFDAFAQSGDATSGTVVEPVYRAFNPTTNDHFYTTNTQELSNAAASGYYHTEGIAFYAQ